MTTEHRKFQCRTCEDWATLVAPGGKGTIPCPEPVHGPARTARPALGALLPAGLVLKSWMLTDSPCAAALRILAAYRHTDPRVWTHVAGHSIDFPAILAEPGWTGAELALLNAAANLYGESNRVDLDTLAVSLDTERWTALLDALSIRRTALRRQQL